MIVDEPWWEHWPEVLEREEAAFKAAGLVSQRDDAAIAKGIMRLRVTAPTPPGDQELLVVYPDNYPYFRCQVYAPGLDLPLHQNPFERNLCLIGRRTHYWDLDRTAADLITEQLPKAIASAEAGTPAEAEGLEERQAEPFSDYYPYQHSMIVVQSDWTIGPEHRRGALKIGTIGRQDQLPDPLIRGTVLEVRAESGEVLCSVDAALRRAFPGKELEGRWARVNEPIRIAREGKFIEELLRLHPQLKDAWPNHVKDGWLRIWGVLFPEQTAHRVMGEGWVFACAVDAKRPNVGRPPRPRFRNSPCKDKHKKGRR